MSIQQTVNQGLAVAAALGTQRPQYQAKVAKEKENTEFNKLKEQIDRAIDVANARTKEDKKYGEIDEGTIKAYEKVADLYEKQNSVKPNLKSSYMNDIWIELSRDQRRQFEAQERTKIQQEAAEEQRKRIRETIMKV